MNAEENFDACKHLTKCADSVCKYRMAAAEPAPARTHVDSLGFYRNDSGQRVDAAGNLLIIDREELTRFLAQIGGGDPDTVRRRATYIETVCLRLTPDPLLATLTRENEMLTKQVRDLAEDVQNLLDDNEQMLSAWAGLQQKVDAVSELHVPFEFAYQQWCHACSSPKYGDGGHIRKWPCPTVEALQANEDSTPDNTSKPPE